MESLSLHSVGRKDASGVYIHQCLVWGDTDSLKIPERLLRQLPWQSNNVVDCRLPARKITQSYHAPGCKPDWSNEESSVGMLQSALPIHLAIQQTRCWPNSQESDQSIRPIVVDSVPV